MRQRRQDHDASRVDQRSDHARPGHPPHNRIRGHGFRWGGARMKPHGILWAGVSPIDGAPIVAIATAKRRSRNRKTGAMVQVWILRSDVEPHTAVYSGQDSSVCGSCPMRSREGFVGRACYVRVPQAPLSVYRAYSRGSYSHVYPEAFAGWRIRWGAYGDPAMLPEWLVQACSEASDGWTGYTHQWRHEWAEWGRDYFMASVETQRGETVARGSGWGTFRVGRVDGSDRGKAILCPSESGISCADCGMCDGRDAAVYIPAHGPGANVVPAERLVRR